MPVIIRAEEEEDNLLECQNNSEDLKTRIDAVGRIVIGFNSEPDDSDIANGECAIWYDGNATVRFKAKTSGGLLKVGTVTLVDAP